MPVDQVRRISGTINEDHKDIVGEVFGEDVVDRMDNCGQGSTFLEILFEMEKKTMRSKIIILFVLLVLVISPALFANDYAVRVLNAGYMGMGSVVQVGDEAAPGWRFALIATADHVVTTDTEVSVEYRDGEIVSGGAVLIRNEKLDIAIIVSLVPANVSAIEISPVAIKEGDDVHYVGKGWRDYNGEASPLSFSHRVWTDVVCYPGDSGGPVMIAGKLAGVQSGGLEWAPDEPKRTWPTRSSNVGMLRHMVTVAIDSGRWDDELSSMGMKAPKTPSVLDSFGSKTSLNVDGMDDYKDGDKDRNGYTLLLFGTEWCGPCEALKAQMPVLGPKFARAGVNHMLYVDGDKWVAFRQTQGIAFYPTLVLYKDGVELTRVYGLVPSAYMPRIKKAIELDKQGKK